VNPYIGIANPASERHLQGYMSILQMLGIMLKRVRVSFHLA
jgi:hypothetical protein